MTRVAGFALSSLISRDRSQLMKCGRDDSMYGASGTRRAPSIRGSMIGPPALIAYAVEPVGVLTRRPSDLNCSESMPSMITPNLSIFAGRLVTIRTSLRASPI